MNIPTKPLEKTLDEHHKAIGDIVQFLESLHQNGLGAKGFTQDELDNMKDPSQAGKIFFNETTGKLNVTQIDPSNKVITVKEI